MADRQYTQFLVDADQLQKSGVYQIRCLVSGKVYVGSTVRFRKRWIAHVTDLNKGIHHTQALQNAWNKYGAESFVFEILELADKPDLIRLEQEWMERLKPFRGRGYNGRIDARSNLGVRHSEEIKARMRGRKHRPESIEKMRIVKTGLKHSAETRAKLSAIQTGKRKSPETTAKARQALKLMPRKPEWNAAISAGKTGKKIGPQTQEWIAKRVAKIRGKKMAPGVGFKRWETRRKNAARPGKTQTTFGFLND